MGDEYQKRTRDTLGKIIKKPPLTDKLLSKPPFRFLHDITTEVIRTTGFLNGLFSPEDMDSRNVSAKDDKIKFLQKIIDVVTIVSGEQLTVKPLKVVAGHEPDKTNELLQAIAKCINRDLSSDDAVQQVLTGKKSSKVQEKPPSGSSKKRDIKEKSQDQRRSKRETDNKEPERERSRDRRRRSAGREKRDASRENEEGAGEGNEERDRRRHRETSQERGKDRSGDRRERRKTVQESKTMMKDFRQQGIPKSSNSASSALKPTQSTTSQEKKIKSSAKSRKSKNKSAKESLSNDKLKLKKKKDEEMQQEAPGSADSQMNEEEQNVRNKPSVDGEEGGTERPGGSGRPPRPASAKGHRRRPADKSSRVEDPDISSGSRSRPARPPSARPAAPRVRKRPDPAEEEIARMESAGQNRTAPLIVDRGSHQADGGMSSSDEDEQFLVQEENYIDPPDMGKLSPVGHDDTNGETKDEEHGGLVRKILKTKKELETSASKGANVTGKKRTEIERTPVNEAQRRKERELVMREIEKLRTSVQKLCRSAVPLGKIIDYIQEDMDSMQNELLQWKKENKEHIAKLMKEESITVETIKPLQSQLQDLDQSISAHMDMIAASKCNVIRNQEKIDKMISGVTAKS